MLLTTIARTFCALAIFLVLSSLAAAQTPLSQPQLGAGWATFGLALPMGAAADGVQVGTLPTQTDVKTRWPDGSIRFAIVTTNVPAVGTFPVSAASLQSGTFAPAVPDAEVRLTIGTEVYSARVGAPSADSWLAGPHVREWRSVVTPTSASEAHPFLRVIFDTRVYSDGQARLDVTVENVLDVAGATSVNYAVEIVHAGEVLFAKPDVTHSWLTRWRQALNVPGLELSDVTPDFEPASAAGAIPRYLPTVSNTVQALGDGPNFEILGNGSLNPDMRDPGGRPEIAPYPDWAARYIVHRDPTQRQLVLANGDLGGSWPVHILDSSRQLVSIDERPDFWLDGRCKEAFFTNCAQGDFTGVGSLIPDKAHLPSLAYVPYLITGDRYYADEMAYWANWALLATYPVERENQKGLLYYYEIRGFAWTLRNAGDAVAYLPDGYPGREYLRSKLLTNLQWADDYTEGKVTTGRYGQNRPLHPLGISFYYEDPNNEPGVLRVAEWENYYLAWSLDHLLQQGFAGGTKLRDRIARLAVAGYASEPQFPRSCAFYYRPRVGRVVDGAVDFSGFDSLQEFASGAACLDTRDLSDGQYGLWQRPALMIAASQGMAGAAEAYAYMMGYSSTTNGTVLDRANEFAGWALAANSTAPPPAPDTAAPIISEIAASSSGTTVTIAWTTDEPADSQIEYGPTAQYGLMTPLHVGQVTSHSISIGGLAPSTTYHYRIRSRDAAGNPAVSDDQVFTTSTVSTITLGFDDLEQPYRLLTGEYPAGVVDWGTTDWFLSGPFGFESQSISFSGPEIAQASFTLLAPHIVVSLEAYNGTSSFTDVTLSCATQPMRSFRVPPAEISRIDTGWTGTCVGPVTIVSGNSWDTNFKNIVLASPPPGDTEPPLITGVSATATATSATIRWTTDEPADSIVQYGLTNLYGGIVVLSANVTEHVVQIEGLSPGTQYHYLVRSTDASGNPSQSEDLGFVTATPPDQQPPLISGVQVTDMTPMSAVIRWTTNEPADSTVEYGETPAYGGVSHSPLKVTSHFVLIENLAPATTYHYRIRSSDAAGNASQSADLLFATATPPDEQAPVITGVQATDVTATSAIIRWTTDEVADSKVEYGETAAYGSVVQVPSNVTDHIVMIAGLRPGTTYHYRVSSRDASPARNLSQSGDFTFESPQAPDEDAPVVTNVRATDVTTGSALIRWETNEVADSTVEYGLTSAYGTVVPGPSNVTDHVVAIEGLLAGTTYHYRVSSRDEANNSSQSVDFVFTTLEDVQTPVLSLTPAPLNFGIVSHDGSKSSGTPAQVITMTLSQAGDVDWQVSANQPWVSIYPASGRGAANLKVSILSTAAALPTGRYSATLTVTATGAANSPTAAINLDVYQRGQTTAPSGAIDVPTVATSSFSGALLLSGWALDDIGVSRLRVYREEKKSMERLEDAIVIRGARPDIAAMFPARPLNHQSAWAVIIPADELPRRGSNSYTLRVYAEDYDGREALIGTRTVRPASSVSPFDIDDVDDLIQDLFRLPSSVEVWVDGSKLTWANWSRLGDGVHTITRIVRDASGNATSSVGWYFTISGWTVEVPSDEDVVDALRPVVAPASAIDGMTMSADSLEARVGYGASAPVQMLAPDADGIRHVSVAAGGLLRVSVAGAHAGYQVTEGGLAVLPVGSMLNTDTGAFAWQAGVGFGGAHDLVFVKTGAEGTQQIRLRVTVR